MKQIDNNCWALLNPPDLLKSTAIASWEILEGMQQCCVVIWNYKEPTVLVISTHGSLILLRLFKFIKNQQNQRTMSSCFLKKAKASFHSFQKPQRTGGFHWRAGNSIGGCLIFSKRLRNMVIYQNQLLVFWKPSWTHQGSLFLLTAQHWYAAVLDWQWKF